MSRNTSDRGDRVSFSPLQRRACIVLACCALALILTIVGVVIAFGGLFGSKSGYDKDLYPVDTTLGAILTQGSDAGTDYLSGTVFAGDQNTVALSDQGLITLNQYVGKDALKISDLIKQTCVYFSGDSASYTIPQALAKMKPRRVVVTFGTNNATDGTAADTFLQDYRQALKAISTAYSYCDIIVNAVPPVVKDKDNAATQQLIDQYNQALANMCNEDGYKFLNSSEVLKDSTGYAEASYFDSGKLNKTGANTLVQYLRTHPYQSDDRRPDTNDIPQRAAQAASSTAATAAPSPTPTPLKATYSVEKGKGTLTGNGKTGVTSLEFDVDAKSNISVTAVAADGYTFYKWSDGLTTATRYDTAFKQDLSVTAMFNDTRVALSLDKGDTTLSMGQTLTVTAKVTLGDKDYDNTKVQWSVNDDLQATAGNYTFTGSTAGSYTLKAGIEINGVYQSATIKITVSAPPTTVTISGPASIRAGDSTTLSAATANGSGDTTWTCDQKTDWKATGSQVQFTASQPGSYTVKATNNGVTASFTVTVTEAPTPSPSPSPSPTPAAG